MHLFDSTYSYGCGQGQLGMPKVIINIKSVICQARSQL